MDKVDGGGADILLGGTENDELYGEAGNDILDGGAGIDHLEGGAGDDTYLDVSGEDSVFDNQGNNTISLATATGLGATGLSTSTFTNADGGTSLQLDIALDTGETLKIQSAFFGNQSTIQFANGDALDLETLVGESLDTSLNNILDGGADDMEWRLAA